MYCTLYSVQDVTRGGAVTPRVMWRRLWPVKQGHHKYIAASLTYSYSPPGYWLVAAIHHPGDSGAESAYPAV